MSRNPAITSLLNGQAIKLRFGSISVTASLGSRRRNVRAQLAPPKPPPITATRAADLANEAHGKADAATTAAIPPTTALRADRRGVSMSIGPEMERRGASRRPLVSGGG